MRIPRKRKKFYRKNNHSFVAASCTKICERCGLKAFITVHGKKIKGTTFTSFPWSWE